MRRFDLTLPYGDNNDLSYYLPDTVSQPLPVIIVSPGFGDTKELSPAASHLCDVVMNVPMALVSFSPFSFGNSPGADADYTYGRWSANLEDILHWVREQSWADGERIGCFAISSGTTAAIRYAQRVGELAFIVSVATCISIHVGMNHSPVHAYLRHALLEQTEAIPEYFGKQVGEAHYIDYLLNAPIFHLWDIKCPIYFLQGAEDNPWRRSDAWIGQRRCRKPRLWRGSCGG